MCLHLFFVVWSAPPVPHWHTQCSATSEKGKKIKRSLCRNIVELDMDLLFMFGFSGWGKKYNSLIRSREIGTPTQQESQHGVGLAKQVHWKNKKKLGQTEQSYWRLIRFLNSPLVTFWTVSQHTLCFVRWKHIGYYTSLFFLQAWAVLNKTNPRRSTLSSNFRKNAIIITTWFYIQSNFIQVSFKCGQ